MIIFFIFFKGKAEIILLLLFFFFLFLSVGYFGNHHWQQQPCSLEICSAHWNSHGVAEKHCCKSARCYWQGLGRNLHEVQQWNVS